MVIRYKEFCFDVDESALGGTGNARADELICETRKGNAASSSAKKKRKKFQIFSRDRGGEVSKVEKVATRNEGTKDVKVENVADKSAGVNRKEIAQTYGTRDIYVDSIPRNSRVITGDKGNLKEGNEDERTKTYMVSSPQGGSNAILYAKESPYNQKENETERSSTLVLRTRLHCDDCIRKIRKCISKYKGVKSAALDASKDQVSVTGVVDMKELVSYLKDKIKRNVEVVPTRKGGGEEIKDKFNTGDLSGAGDYGEKEVQTPLTKYVNQRDSHGTLPHPITHWNDGELHDQNYGMEAYQGYMNHGASFQRFNQSYAPDIFSDENPNACSIM